MLCFYSLLDVKRSLEYRRLSECKKSPPVGAATEYEIAIKALRHRSKPEKVCFLLVYPFYTTKHKNMLMLFEKLLYFKV